MTSLVPDEEDLNGKQRPVSKLLVASNSVRNAFAEAGEAVVSVFALRKSKKNKNNKKQKDMITGGEEENGPVMESGAMSTADEEQYKKDKRDVFLSHNWGDGYVNHRRVKRIKKELKKVHNITTWFDEDDMDNIQEANLGRKMQHGIDNSKLVLVFVTKEYMKKVENKTLTDNCKLEFEYAVREKPIIPVVMEADMKNTADWAGLLKLHLGGHKYVEMWDETNLSRNVQVLAKRIRNELLSLGGASSLLSSAAGAASSLSLSSTAAAKCTRSESKEEGFSRVSLSFEPESNLDSQDSDSEDVHTTITGTTAAVGGGGRTELPTNPMMPIFGRGSSYSSCSSFSRGGMATTDEEEDAAADARLLAEFFNLFNGCLSMTAAHARR